MPMIQTTRPTNPLEPFLDRYLGGRSPAPLIETAIEVDIRGPLAMVSTRRLYGNTESRPIEAVMTFPVPVHATVFSLEAEVDGRRLVGKAQPRSKARETYETAIDEGHAAILHEEVLRGVHMVSVGQLAPGKEVTVTDRWVTSLASIGDDWRLRIPTTVGQIYGISPLAETDDLVHGGEAARASLIVHVENEPVVLVGGNLTDGRAEVGLDAPIELSVKVKPSATVSGYTAEGRDVEMQATKAPQGTDRLDVAVLLDHSGSMCSRAWMDQVQLDKHEAAITALAGVASDLRNDDRIDLWEFDTVTDFVGSTTSGTALTPRDRFKALLERLQPPRGGTDIGGALEQVLTSDAPRDILLVTDGLSHALDVQGIARRGRRISVVLIGEDSLEANVGHLSALTGGDIFCASEDNVSSTLQSALNGLRGGAPSNAGWENDTLYATRQGTAFTVTFGSKRDEPIERTPFAHAVSAFTVALQLPLLEEDNAATLAASEGLVGHLTSLVLVDTAGEAVEGLPEFRKIGLSTPRTDRSGAFYKVSLGSAAPRNEGISLSANLMSNNRATARRRRGAGSMPSDVRSSNVPESVKQPRSEARQHGEKPDLPEIQRTSAANDLWLRLVSRAKTIDWDLSAAALSRGDLSELPPELARDILEVSHSTGIVDAARGFGLEPLLFVIACLAEEFSAKHRGAARVLRQLVQTSDRPRLREIMAHLLSQRYLR